VMGRKERRAGDGATAARSAESETAARSARIGAAIAAASALRYAPIAISSAADMTGRVEATGDSSSRA
jgi:hypothetical protein